jgi:hypothetical protein
MIGPQNVHFPRQNPRKQLLVNGAREEDMRTKTITEDGDRKNKNHNTFKIA